MLLDRIVATNGIKAPNPPLTTSIFGYVAQIGECYFPLLVKYRLPLSSWSCPKARRQRCFVHLLRNICSKVRPSDKSSIDDDFMSVARQDTREDGVRSLREFVEKWKARYPKLAIWAEKTENILTFYDFAEPLRKTIYTNNRIESFNKDIKRMLKKQIQFVSEEALEKRLVSMALHYNEKVGKRKVRCWREIVEYFDQK